MAGYVPRLSETDLEQAKSLLEEDEEEPVAGDPKTFALLARQAQIPTERGWRSLPCLAACKADVDNLGMLFGLGLDPLPEAGEARARAGCFTISHLAMLSRMMHHFFSSHMIRVIEREFPNIYVVFAGGDDLFVIGPWSESVDFAERLHEDFARFTGGNPEVTLSAGIALARPGLPVRGIRAMAEHDLEASKGYAPPEDGEEAPPSKNAATLFGVTCAWDEFSRRLDQGRWLERLCLDGHVTQGFVRRLLGYSRQARKFEGGDMNAAMYRSHMTYDMARNCDERKTPPDDLAKLRGLCHDRAFSRMELAATWALYRTRERA